MYCCLSSYRNAILIVGHSHKTSVLAIMKSTTIRISSRVDRFRTTDVSVLHELR